MSRREDIDNAIWSDPDFSELSSDAKLIYLWSFTNQRCGMSGLYKMTKGAICFECSMPPKRVDGALLELAGARFAFFQDGVMFVRSRVKHMRTRTPQIARSIALDLAKVSDGHPVKLAFVAEYAADGWAMTDVPENLIRSSSEVQTVALASQLPEPQPNVSEPQPRFLGNGSGKGKGNGGGPGETDKLPDDLAEELHERAGAVHTALLRVHAVKGGQVPTLAAVGRAIAAYPLREHTRSAAEFEEWWLYGKGQNRKLTDHVKAFRNWISNEPDTTSGSGTPGRPPGATGAAMLASLESAA